MMKASTHGGGGGGGAGAGAGAGAGFGLEPASPPAASSVTLPIVSAHGGLSGSKYDRVVAKPLAQEANNLGSTVAAMLDNRSLQHAINKELLQFSRKQSLRSTAKKHAKTRYVAGTQSAAQPKKPAPNRIVLDEEHVSTLRTIFSLLDTDMDGELTDNQLRTAVTAVGIPPTRRFLKELRRLVPAGHGVDFETFCYGIEHKLYTEPVHMEDVDELFEMFEDPDRNGMVSHEHMAHVLAGVSTTHRTQLTHDEVGGIMAELGIPRKDLIEYREFVKALSSGFVNFK